MRDGDTIEVGGLPIRLSGLAAPEGDEPGGAGASKAMEQLVLGRELRCELDGERTHDRCAGICYLNGADIAALMVRQGSRPCLSQVRRGAMPRLNGRLPPGVNDPGKIPVAGVPRDQVIAGLGSWRKQRVGTTRCLHPRVDHCTYASRPICGAETPPEHRDAY